MDAKALAKSKRAHSQHHSKSKRSHSHQTSKPQSVGASGEPSGKKVVEKPERRQGVSALPSNWDRYGEEDDLGLEKASGNSGRQASDVIVPKSKGADYRHLIAEAESHSYYDCFPSLDDVLPGLDQGVGSMLSVRGEAILSWIEDDNFTVYDRPTVNHEVSFLSLNLHSLAEQLAKVDLSERLFIEADLLPPELSKASGSQDSDVMHTTSQSEGDKRISDELPFHCFSEKVRIMDQNDEVTSSNSSSSGLLDQTLSIRESVSVNAVEVDLTQVGNSSKGKPPESTAQAYMKSVADPKKNLTMFQATAAEAELDMLLDSFSETKLFDSSGIGSINTMAVMRHEAIIVQPEASRKSPDSSKTSSSIPIIDDVLDDLLEETSSLMNQKGSLLPQKVEVPAPNIQYSLPSGSGTKSKVLDDFDSWLDTI